MKIPISCNNFSLSVTEVKIAGHRTWLIYNIVMNNLVFVCLLGMNVYAEDPRLEKKDVRECVEEAKKHLRSEDYSGEKEATVIGACRNVDSLCLTEVTESLHPSDGYNAKKFLELVRACRGTDMGKCFAAVKATTTSHNRREYDQIRALLAKCK